MNPEELKHAWQAQTSQTRPAINAELLLKQVQCNDRAFTAMIFWRDVREVVVGLLMVPLWLYLGVKNSQPWSWYLTVPALLWVTGYMLADRMRHKPQPHEPAEPLRRRTEGSLAQVEHQIWLLRNVHWWAILPLAVAMLAFFGQVTWQERAGGWWMVIATSGVVAIGTGVLAVVFWLNQYAVRFELEPRRRELETLLMSLEDETPDAN